MGEPTVGELRCIDVYGWANVNALELNRGISGAVERFRQVASEAPGIIASSLPEILASVDRDEQRDLERIRNLDVDEEDARLEAEYQREAEDAMWRACEQGKIKLKLSSTPGR